jgi:hypothetical protein
VSPRAPDERSAARASGAGASGSASGAGGSGGAPADDPEAEELEVLLRVASLLRKIRFGTLLIVVQDGKVVQIETAEKHRLR